jgi:hypothetical protein
VQHLAGIHANEHTHDERVSGKLILSMEQLCCGTRCPDL